MGLFFHNIFNQHSSKLNSTHRCRNRGKGGGARGGLATPLSFCKVRHIHNQNPSSYFFCLSTFLISLALLASDATATLLLHIFIFTGTGCIDGWTQSGTSCYLFSSQYDVSSWKAAGTTCANYQVSTNSPTYLARIETNQELVCIDTSTKQGLINKDQRYKIKIKFGFITSFHR